MAFASWRDGDGEIYVMDVADALQGTDGSNLQQLTDNRFEDEFPAWRPVATVVSPTEPTTTTPMPSPGTISPTTVDQTESLHTLSGTDLAFSPDGALLATSSNTDYTIKLWDVESGEVMRTFNASSP